MVVRTLCNGQPTHTGTSVEAERRRWEERGEKTETSEADRNAARREEREGDRKEVEREGRSKSCRERVFFLFLSSFFFALSFLALSFLLLCLFSSRVPSFLDASSSMFFLPVLVFFPTSALRCSILSCLCLSLSRSLVASHPFTHFAPQSSFILPFSLSRFLSDSPSAF